MTSPEKLVQALGGHRSGAGWVCRCPAHDDRVPSLSVRERDGIVLVRCFAGCEQKDVVAALRARGLMLNCKPHPAVGHAPHGTSSADDATRIKTALTIWAAARTIQEGDLAAEYLRSRGLLGYQNDALRTLDRVRHPTGIDVPAMVAAIHRGEEPEPCAIQLTALMPPGRKADLNPARWTRGVARGGAVRLAAVRDQVIVAEGVEDALAIIQMTGEPAWATLGTSGFVTFVPPTGLRSVTLAPDGDEAGENSIAPAGARLTKLGLQVSVARAILGADWADLLEDFEERSAILEFLAGMDRPEAERRAWQMVTGR